MQGTGEQSLPQVLFIYICINIYYIWLFCQTADRNLCKKQAALQSINIILERNYKAERILLSVRELYVFKVREKTWLAPDKFRIVSKQQVVLSYDLSGECLMNFPLLI